MFKLEDSKVIGTYISKLIKKRGYKSDRAFCKAYLEHEHRDVNDDEIRKMANRISQMLKGTKGKGIQIYDLPVFCDLLGVTCEEILSAGQSHVIDANRVTNYSVAFSDSTEDWEAYIHREDKLILNPDEYGKTVIDYALEFKNFNLIKYLIENKYIWFDSGNENDYVLSFGAGTSIERRHPYKIDDYLQYMVLQKEQLRMDVIALAVKSNDKKILDELRAREIPQLYYKTHFWNGTQLDFYESYNEEMIEQIITASNEIIDYFTESFEIDDRVKYKDGSKHSNRFIFPYISELLEGIIENKHDFTEIALKKCIEHNKLTYETLKIIIETSIKKELEKFDFGDKEYLERCKPDIIQSVFRDYDFNENGRIISFRGFSVGMGIVTNIACTEAKASDIKIQHLIDELNSWFDKVVDIMNEYLIKE